MQNVHDSRRRYPFPGVNATLKENSRIVGLKRNLDTFDLTFLVRLAAYNNLHFVRIPLGQVIHECLIGENCRRNPFPGMYVSMKIPDLVSLDIETFTSPLISFVCSASHDNLHLTGISCSSRLSTFIKKSLGTIVPSISKLFIMYAFMDQVFFT
ncbi:hypothetical protein ALC53_05201 [Atta colombica]|uniref:Uncharacterized protein n=1 Tax=Atta colombica TaxID=520822 RepID=A0A195BIZ7_9HYME|nr:hypothetical protein ALC53_05201 [Atta colombica]